VTRPVARGIEEASMKRVFLVGMVAAVVAMMVGTPASAQSGTMSLGSVTLRQSVNAGGETLAAGTYQVRLTGNNLDAVVGETPGAEQWVEFVRGGQVRAKVAASVIPDSEIGDIAKGPRPGKGSSRVDLLKGNDYVRVWINRGGNNYLIHMPPA
jgi:hypothetical protein